MQQPTEHERLVCDYYLEVTGTGPFLPYEDHQVIRVWLEQSSLHHTLLALSEVLTNYYERHSAYPRNIRMIHKDVMKILQFS
ncbi:MAG: hypothetical protein OXC40_01905 [Proteobacteria bacterium]|nr:hypothetical protein [Pseudomonadota bacterium]